MSKAPSGALVSIYYDGWQDLQPGDALQTPSGRVYVVAGTRKQLRGKHLGRQHLSCVVSDGVTQISGKTYPLHWYPRKRKR